MQAALTIRHIAEMCVRCLLSIPFKFLLEKKTTTTQQDFADGSMAGLKPPQANYNNMMEKGDLFPSKVNFGIFLRKTVVFLTDFSKVAPWTFARFATHLVRELVNRVTDTGGDIE